jgi:SAM-dependent methyltransferase
MPPDFNVREAWCPGCGAKRRTSDLVSALLRVIAPDGPVCLTAALKDMEKMRIFEAQADGALHAALAPLPGYVCSEYFEEIPRGELTPEGIRCENLEHLSFPDESFHLAISQDVLEHVSQPWLAFREIERVLKPGGYHLFTVPIHEGRRTTTRVGCENGRAVHLLPPVYHGDPMREGGSLVYTDFGDDVVALLHAQSIEAQVVVCGKEYDAAEIPWIDDAEAHRRYSQARSSGRLLDYFRYNSVVLASRKRGIVKEV